MKHTSKNYIVGHGITLLFVVAVIVCVSTHMDPTEDGGRISTRFNNNRAFANLYNTEFHQNDSASIHVISSNGLQQLDPTSGGGMNSHQHQTNRERRRLENGDELVTVDVSFESILKTVIFLMTSWIFAVFSQMIGLPSLVGEITTGFILGPPLLDFVAYPEAMVLIGSFGLIGLLLDSGINLDIAQLRETGSRAVMMAVTGTILALGVGLGMGYMADSDQDFRASFAIGAAFAPSSFGVASQVLKQGEVLNTPMGQVIVAASVVDDILGLILLSIMEVLVKDSPTVFDYIKPFLASFGYLFVLGYAGIKIIPNIVENKILPRFSEDKRDLIAFSMLFILMAAYLPIMFYSGASYLTGAFLAGLSFSQIHSVHTSYLSSGPHLKVWLMRIFFAATIGFQVPIRSFSDSDVLNWGFFYLIPILAKLPLGCMVPRLHSDLPDDFPYNPYHRDVLVTTLAMLCRGEFNFIIASFALNAGVIHPDQYAAIVFSILLSAIFAPLALTKILKYYNEKFKVLLQGKHKIERIGDTTDGSRPLFLAIQARTPITWGIQDKFVHALEKAGVSIVDHRTWHTLGLDAVDITEIFCQDSKQRVRLRNAFANSYSQRTPTKGSSKGSSHEDEEVEKIQGFPMIKESPSREALAVMEDKQEMEEDAAEIMAIEARKEEIRQALADCFGNVDKSEYAIQVSRWRTLNVFDDDDDDDDGSTETGYRFVSQLPPDEVEILDDSRDEEAQAHRRNLSQSLSNTILRPSRVRANSTGNVTEPRTTRARAHFGEATDSQPDPSRRNSFQEQPVQRSSLGRAYSFGAASDGDSVMEEPKLDVDLWDVDDITHNLLGQGFFMTPTDEIGSQIVTAGWDRSAFPIAEIQRPGHRRIRSRGRSRANSFDAGMVQDTNQDVEANTIKDRLHGYVRP